MDANIQNSIAILRASVEEGRPENVRYRQDQLQSLHAALRESATAITTAIAVDSGCSPQDADAEFYLGMDALKKSYESLKFEQSLKEEYSVAHGKNNINRRVALGLVAIRPSRHSRLHSVLTPLVAAIAAGNCILLELDMSSKEVDSMLRSVLAALDRDTFQISSSQLSNEQLQDIDLFVDQTNTSQPSSRKFLASAPNSRAITIVDRKCDVEAAAVAVTKARLSSNCSSPYSPDLILVNEYVAEAFASACLKYANSLGPSSKLQNISTEERKVRVRLEEAERRGEVRIRRSTNTEVAVIEILDRGSSLASSKVEGQNIFILSSTGLVDSVNSQRSAPPISVCYLFASFPACKFLSEQIASPATFFNQIPTEILIGPASPLNFVHNLHPRYVPEMFSAPRPQFVTPPNILPESAKLKEIALQKLPPTGQRPGHAVGFFEQGIFIGLGSTALVVLPMLGWTLFTAGKQGWKFIEARMR